MELLDKILLKSLEGIVKESIFEGIFGELFFKKFRRYCVQVLKEFLKEFMEEKNLRSSEEIRTGMSLRISRRISNKTAGGISEQKILEDFMRNSGGIYRIRIPEEIFGRCCR